MADASPNGILENPKLFEGDISGVRSTEELRNAIIGLNYRWPQATIPYVVSTSFSSFHNKCHSCNTIKYLQFIYITKRFKRTQCHRQSNDGVSRENLHPIRTSHQPTRLHHFQKNWKRVG